MSVPPERPRLTLQGCLLGMRLTWPLLPGIIVFACAFGTAAAQKGLTLVQTLAMSGIVFAGAAQMVALGAWRDSWSLAGVLEIALIATVINTRMVLMGAALQPWMAGLPAVRSGVSLFFFTDANWLLAMRYRTEGGTDFGVFVGAGVFLWIVWLAATAPGFLAGALVTDPGRLGLDLVMPIFFATMLVPLWAGAAPARPWAVAGLVALAVHEAMPGYTFIVAGAVAGALAGAFLDDRP